MRKKHDIFLLTSVAALPISLTERIRTINMHGTHTPMGDMYNEQKH